MGDVAKQRVRKLQRCHIQQMTKLIDEMHDVKGGGDVIIVLIPSTKTKHPRSSCVTEPPWLNIIRKYMSLRPFGTP
jgi:hypothetical protein